MWYNTILKRYKIEENSAIYSNIDGPRGHYAKCDKPDTEMQMPYDLTFMQNLTKTELLSTESRLVLVQGSGCHIGAMGEVVRGQKLPVVT